MGEVDWISIVEAAVLLGVSRSAAYIMARMGKLGAYGPGPQRTVSRAVVLERRQLVERLKGIGHGQPA